ncbi:hypothetical protein Goshw_021367, partial [Gossypium schwendimanii]|nr:hypothetical protein [Gossypium schwendimanii]
MSLLIGSHNKSRTFPQLETLQLSSCNLTEFPEFIKSQNKLTYLDLSNNRIHGLVPNWLWKSTLDVLHLSSNAIDIPNQFPFDDANSSFPMLRWLDLRYCNISMFPAFLKSQESLIALDLSNNQIRGAVPNWQNNFSSSIPDFGGATLLSTLQVNDNKLEGKLPSSLVNCTSLKILNLGNSTLHDTFPLWLGKLPRLMVLILLANRFYGPIKHLENNFPALNVLDIASNKFFGKLSIEFFQATHKLRSLKINGNNLEGKLPRSLANCRNLEVLDLGKNMIHDTFLTGEVSIEFFQSLRGMMVIDGNKAKLIYVGDNFYYQDSVTLVNK